MRSKTETVVDESIRTLAGALGEAPEAIKADNPRWTQLLQEGVIVKITLRRWRGKTKLELDGDLGIPVNGEGQLYRELLDIGSKLLLPRSIHMELNSIDSAARQNVERFGYKTFWGQFIPATAYADWKAKDLEYQAKYFAVRDRISQFYDEIMAGQLDEYAESARIAYVRRNRLQPGQDLDYRYLPVDEFVDNYMTKLRALIPTKEQIAASFAYEVDLAYIPLPSLLAADTDRAAEIAASKAVYRIEVDGAQRRQAQLDEMNREVMERAKEQKLLLVDGFLKDVVKQLRSLIYDAVVTVSDAINKNGYLHPRSATQLQGLVAQVERLNFFGDEDATKMVQQLQALTNRAAPDRDPAELQDALRNVAIVTRASLMALGDQPRHARILGTVDSVQPEELKRARRALDLPIGPEPRSRREDVIDVAARVLFDSPQSSNGGTGIRTRRAL